MKKAASSVALIAVAGLMMVTAPQRVEARPWYLKAFGEKYKKVEGEINKRSATEKCGVCHGNEGKNKKLLSEYATALKAALGEELPVKATEVDKINAALDEVGKKECEEGNGKTYSDLLNDGKLPPPHKDK